MTRTEALELELPEIPEGFTPWEGGEWVGRPSQRVKVLCRNGTSYVGIAGLMCWHNRGWPEDIIAYRRVEKYEEPKPATPAPCPGERYIGGIIHPDGRICHTFLLPGDDLVPDWGAGIAWAKEKGGDLPSRIEQAMMLSFMPEEFQKESYWSNAQHAGNSYYAWYQYFSNGIQDYDDKYGKLRVRAVRREWEEK